MELPRPSVHHRDAPALWRGAPLLRLLLLLAALLCAAAQPGQETSGSSYGLHANFNPAMVIVILGLICVVVLFVFASIYLRQCIGGGGGGRPARIVSRDRGEKAARGLDRTAIDAFPIFLFSAVKDLEVGDGGMLECAVCITEFDGSETVRLLPSCGHAFHPDCIGAWLSSNTTCPVCRSNLSPPAGDAAAGSAEAGDSGETAVDRDPRSGDGGEPETRISIGAYGDGRRESRAVEEVHAAPPQESPHSHSAGHSLSRVHLPIPTPASSANWERYTLRLPEHARKQLMTCRDLTRAASSNGAGRN